MADNKREQEKTELYRTIWALANDLRGSVDGWDFKQYVLGMLFYRYISENLTAYLNKGEWETGNTAFNYANLSDEKAERARDDMVKTKGFFILPRELFGNLVNEIDKAEQAAKEKAAKEGKEPEVADLDEDLNEKLQNIFKSIEKSAIGSASEENFKGLFADIDVNSNKLGPTVIKRNKRLKNLILVINSMNVGAYQENSIDAFGDAYEYLMSMYASNAGKSGGEFFTPQEVSELLTRIALVGKTEVNKVYDPAVGSGSLLLKFAKILGKENVRNGFFGQEINITTYNLCRINMFLHDIGYEKFSIEHGDTLIDPKHWDEEPFEAIVSNPPYSIKWEGDDNSTLINDPRFAPAGVLAPKSKADFAFILHSLHWLATNGTAAIVCFPGIMYRGGAEQKIRKYLIDNNYIECIIQLPDNLFYGTSIATCIMVLKKSKINNKTLFIDASKEYIKVTNNNRLDEETNIKNILEAYIRRETTQYFTYLATKDEIEKADYNLSVSTYVESKDTREIIDIAVLNAKISKIVERENILRAEIDAIIAEIEEA
ncbi:MAG: type I restriction-modification system subunit M [Lactococcus sp.]